MVKNILAFIFLFSSTLLVAQEEKVFLLTKSLTFSKSKNLASPFSMNPGNKPTLFRLVSSSKGISQVQLIQENGKEVNKILYVSSQWFAKGTSESAAEFRVDPNPIVNAVNNANALVCEAPKDLDPLNPCSVLDSGHSDPALFMNCYESIRTKLKLNSKESAYSNLSKLYSLTPSEQKFMASIMTMYGEARGTRPPEENMAMVMKVIENRTKVAKSCATNVTELDVVLQSAQFSMYNPKDPNWKAAISASSKDLEDAMKVYALRNSVYRCENVRDNVCHYHVPGIDLQDWMERKKRVSVSVNGQKIDDHQFYAGVAWAFNPNNPYKRYAVKQGYLK